MAKAKAKAELKKVNKKLVTVRLVGVSPLIQHQWGEKAKEMMRAKQQEGKKTRSRDIRVPEEEANAACYKCADGTPGVLAVALKSAVIEAAHNDLGIPRTLVRKALFVFPYGRDVVIPIEHPDDYKKGGKKRKVEYVVQEDSVRVGAGSADLRYRPVFHQWAVTSQWEVDCDLLQIEDLLNLFDRAGFGVGINDWRPEKGGEFGRFRVDARVDAVIASLD